jgi:hypothetical protein
MNDEPKTTTTTVIVPVDVIKTDANGVEVRETQRFVLTHDVLTQIADALDGARMANSYQ